MEKRSFIFAVVLLVVAILLTYAVLERQKEILSAQQVIIRKLGDKPQTEISKRTPIGYDTSKKA